MKKFDLEMMCIRERRACQLGVDHHISQLHYIFFSKVLQSCPRKLTQEQNCTFGHIFYQLGHLRRVLLKYYKKRHIPYQQHIQTSCCYMWPHIILRTNQQILYCKQFGTFESYFRQLDQTKCTVSHIYVYYYQRKFQKDNLKDYLNS